MNRLWRHRSQQAVLTRWLTISFTTTRQRGKMAKQTLDQLLRVGWGELSHQTFQNWKQCFFFFFFLHPVTRMHHDRDESSFYTTGWHWRMNRLRGHRFYSSLIAHRRKLYILYKCIPNTSCLFFLKRGLLMCPGRLQAGCGSIYASFFFFFSQRPSEVSAQTDCAHSCHILGCMWAYGGAGWFWEKSPSMSCGLRHFYCNSNRCNQLAKKGFVFSLERSTVGIMCVHH